MIRLLVSVVLLLVGAGGVANAATCDVNQYLSGGNCVNCMYNATCDGETYSCNDGFYADGNNQCLACPPNSTCTGPTEFSCMPGTYLYNGVCSQCVNNATCVGGTDTFHCDDGWFRDGFMCRSCAGHVCDGEKLISCGAGYLYYNWNGTYCMDCGAELHCPAGSTISSVTCIEGYYKSSYHCFQCPGEYYCPDGIATISNYMQYCAPGFYKMGAECVPCPDGVVCPGHKEQKCPDGLFWHSDGQCLSYASGDSGMPPNCNPGFFDNGAVCEMCPVENSTCRSVTDFDCVSGFYKNVNRCDVCPQNSTCPAGSTQINCFDGYWLNGNMCSVCTGANYCNNNTMFRCPEFDAGVLESVLPSEDRLINADNLRVTTYSVSGLITNAANCRIGGALFETPDGVYTKDLPWQGDRYWSSDIYWVQTDTVGRYLANAVHLGEYMRFKYNKACTNAPENAIYIGAGSPDGNDCPWRCNDGYFRDGDVCTVCPADFVCIDGKIVCPMGQYASGNSCQDCPDYYADRAPDNTAPQSINECQIKCDAGTYLATARATQCANVGPGYWNDINYTNYGNSGKRNKCPDNLMTIGYGRGADSLTDCGRVMRFGQYSVWLHNDWRTHPSLSVQYGNHVLYGDMIPESRKKALNVEYNGSVYSVYNMDID
ncbi:MAG: hypothetical protein K2M34_03095 [Alphaproteobacteria bacterium]|nr:hypothetical protein [Alphaproteobacteria bacterium]